MFVRVRVPSRLQLNPNNMKEENEEQPLIVSIIIYGSIALFCYSFYQFFEQIAR